MQAPGLRNRLGALLGPRFATHVAQRVTVRGQEPLHGWVLEDLLFEFTDGETSPAWFLRPPDEAAAVPVVLYAHAHGNNYAVGRDELIRGRGALQGDYARDLVRIGCAALCIDMPAFGARQQPCESARAKALLWQGETLFGQMLAEQRAGLDFLCAHPQVRSDSIGMLGLSMGCTLSWWLAALDGRIRAVSALCCLADLGTLVEQGTHDLHGIYMTVPGLLEAARSGQIAGLVAPRAMQIAIGTDDPLTPPEAFAIARADLEAAYSAAEAAERLVFHIEPGGGHAETAQMRSAVLDFLRRELACAELAKCV